jgi:iron(III) transport system substrate-binding protein
MRATRALAAIATTLLATTLFLAQVPTTAQEAPADLVEAAKKEGRVAFYTSFVSPQLHAAVKSAFEKKYGITVDVLNVRASELEERIRTEQGAGRFLGDVIQHGQASITRLFRTGFVQEHGGVPNMKNMIDGQPPEPHEIGSLITGYAIMVNSNLVKPEDEPKSWRDLLDPKWKGKILSDDMRALGGGFAMFSAIMGEPTLGEAWHRQMATQGPVFTRDVGNSERRVARGEYPIWIPQISVNVQGLKGLPVRVITPKEGVAYVRLDVAMLKNAPRPNAAKLFMNFYLSEEFQTVVGSMGLIPVIKGVAEKIPADKRVLEGAKLMGTIHIETQVDYLKLAGEIYK